MQRAKTDNTEVESRIDWGIIFCVLLLALIGLASIYVAASHDSSGSGVVLVPRRDRNGHRDHAV